MMKIRYLFTYCLLLAVNAGAQTPDSWTKKAALGFSQSIGPEPRMAAVAFTIGGKGYLGTGLGRNGDLNDFWEYDTLSKSWTQKANFLGGAREYASGFSIGTKGYIGTGVTGTTLKSDFWEYDPANNTWTQKAAFPGSARQSCAAFSLGAKGYLGTGQDAAGYKNDFWSYNPSTDNWVQIANQGSTGRMDASACATATKGYVGFGYNGTILKDFWEYNPTTNAWTAKPDIDQNGRRYASAAALNGDVYIFFGQMSGAVQGTETYKYSPATNTWLPAPYFYGTGTRGAAAMFSFPGTTYYAFGFNLLATAVDIYNDFWRYDAISDTISVSKATVPAGKTDAVAFTIGNKGYLGTGRKNASVLVSADIWEYDPSTDSWAQKADFGGGVRDKAVGFSIGSKGYLGTGINGSTYYNDFWEFDPVANSWTQKANLPIARGTACSFATSSKGYITGGINSSTNVIPLSDCWEYDPATNGWLQKASLPAGKSATVSFVINDTAYVGGIVNTSTTDIFYRFIPLQNRWDVMPPPPFDVVGSIGFALNGKGYIGLGNSGNYYHYIWKFDPRQYTWSTNWNDYGYFTNAVAMVIGGKVYIGTGTQNTLYASNVFLQIDPDASLYKQLAQYGNYTTTDAVGFSVMNKGVVTGAGSSATAAGNTWIYNKTTNSWSSQNPLPGNFSGANPFVIGDSAYVSSYNSQSFWAYNGVTKAWTQKANFAGVARPDGFGFAVGNKGYVGGGGNQAASFGYTLYSDFWQYDPVANTWTQKASTPVKRFRTAMFSVDTLGYFVAGCDSSGSSRSEMYAYNPALNTWTAKASFPDTNGRMYATAFNIQNRGYFSGGYPTFTTPVYMSDFWEYNPYANAWAQKASTGVPRFLGIGLGIGNKGYLGMGKYSATGMNSDFWEYTPDTYINVDSLTINLCSGLTVPLHYSAVGTFNAGNVFTAQLSGPGGSFAAPVNIGSATGATTGTINITLPAALAPGAGYRIRVVSSLPFVTGEDNGADLSAVAPAAMTLTVTAQPGDTICSGTNVQFTASVVNGGIAPTYQWVKNSLLVGNNSNVYADSSLGNADVITCQVSNTYTCATNAQAADTIVMFVHPLPQPIITQSAGGVLTTGTFSAYQWQLGGTLIPGAASQSYIPVQSGNFTVVVRDTNGCNNSSPVYPFSPLSVTAVTAGQVHVYPNPVSSIIYVDAPFKVNVSLQQIDGKVVMVKQDVNTLDVGYLPDGIYFLKIKRDKNFIGTYKINKVSDR